VVAAAAARDPVDRIFFGCNDSWLQRTTLPDGRALFAVRFERVLAEARGRRDSGERRALAEGALAAATPPEPASDGSASAREGDDGKNDFTTFTFAEQCAALDGDPETVLFAAVQAQWRTNVWLARTLTALAPGPALRGEAVLIQPLGCGPALLVPLGCGPALLAAPLPARAYSWLPSPQLARGFGPQNPAFLVRQYATQHPNEQIESFVTDETCQAAATTFWSSLDRSLHALVADAYGLETPPDLADEQRSTASKPARGFGRAVPKTKPAAPPVSMNLSGNAEATQQWCEQPKQRARSLRFAFSARSARESD
jgi:hypothetical protein